jgi:transcriptional regulator with XRE-family HTH domain
MMGLKTWRERKKLTLEEVSDLTGLSPSMLNRAERGMRHLSVEAQVRISRRLGVPIRHLFPLKEVS